MKRLLLLTPIAALLMGTGLVLAQDPGVSPPTGLPPAPVPVIPATPPLPPPPPLGSLPPPPAPGSLPVLTSGGEPVLERPSAWLTAEFLLWWIKAGPNPAPLATTGDFNDAVPGALGQPGTSAVLGGHDIDFGAFSGGRVSGGYWFGPNQVFGMEASFFALDRVAVREAAGSDDNGNPALFRPINDTILGESALPLTLPGFVSGGMVVSARSQLWGLEANGLAGLLREGNVRLTVVAGFRFLDLDERLDVTTVQNDDGGVLPDPTSPGFAEPPGSTLAVVDSFRTRNVFYGGQVGLRAEFNLSEGWYLEAGGKLALGATHQMIDVNGTTTQFQPFLPPQTIAGGVLALGSNSGHFANDDFSVVPEIEVRIGFRVNTFVTVFAGYDFLYWTNVVRPGDQVSRAVDEGAVPTSNFYDPLARAAAPPPPPFARSGFWAQGADVGLDFHF